MYHTEFFIFQEKQNAVVTYTAECHLEKALPLYVCICACENFILTLRQTLK